jgi:hypothetical protein
MEQYWSKVAVAGPDDCWLWTASLSRGYGQLKVGGRKGHTRKAHRLAWELTNGPIPPGMTIDHLCFTPACQNPAHMEVVTPSENSRRVRANQYKGITHCIRGHEFTDDNTYRYGNRRLCKTCTIERVNLRRRKTKETTK